MLARLELKDKVAIVTGGGTGIGRQIALALAQAGADVVVAARRVEYIEKTAEEVRQLGRRAIAVPSDVCDSRQVDEMVERCLEEMGRLDILVNNAGGSGITFEKSLLDLTDEDWHSTLELNLSSAFYCSRAAARPMIQQGGGAIINIASTLGLRGDRQGIAYGAAKAGVTMLTKYLALHLAPHNIRVNCIAPGYAASWPRRSDEPEEVKRARGRFIPVGRVGNDWECGPLAVYLASDAASYGTGAVFVVDGGGVSGGAAPVGWQPGAGLVEG